VDGNRNFFSLKIKPMTRKGNCHVNFSAQITISTPVLLIGYEA
jgi:hypothetical protein